MLNISSLSSRVKGRYVFIGGATLVLLLFLLSAGVYIAVHQQGVPVYRAVSEVPEAPVAIVFGAGIGSLVLVDRVNTAAALYKSGKVRKILMTGDNAHSNYDEPNAMRSLALALGVPKEDIVCDYAGFRTYDSLYRARDIFAVTQAVLVTQAFHQPRAIYLAKNLGLSVVGIDASRRSYGFEQYLFELREVAACEAAWLDVLTKRKPKLLGKRQPLFPGSEV